MSRYMVRPDEVAVGSGKDSATALAVGSGVVLCLYDDSTGNGGMCYILGPQSRDKKDTMRLLLDKLTAKGIREENLWAKLVGGATIFCLADRLDGGDFAKGNVEYARKWLREQKIPIRAEDTGNNFGRTVSLELEDGNVKITLGNRQVYDI